MLSLAGETVFGMHYQRQRSDDTATEERKMNMSEKYEKRQAEREQQFEHFNDAWFSDKVAGQDEGAAQIAQDEIAAQIAQDALFAEGLQAKLYREKTRKRLAAPNHTKTRFDFMRKEDLFMAGFVAGAACTAEQCRQS